MHTVFPTRSSVSRLTAAALFAALAYLGAAPAVAQTQSLTLTKSGGTFHGGRLANFTIVLTNVGTTTIVAPQMLDGLPGFGVIDWAIASQSPKFNCSIASDDPDYPNQQRIQCDADNMKPGDVNTVTVTGISPDTCLKLDNIATANYSDSVGRQVVTSNSARVNITSATCLPAFVIGDNQNHVAGAYVNFWGDDWWKNNSMTGTVDNGVASFKGWASNADIICGVQWATRPGNSSNPPATIPTDTDIMVIVTDTVLKDGSDITGNIVKILRVRSDGTYGPNPGHPGIGYVTDVVCTKP